MNHRLIIGTLALFAFAIAGIVFGLPRADAVRVLSWIAKTGGAVGMFGLVASMAFGQLASSERFTKERREMLEKTTVIAAKAFAVGFSAFIGALGPQMIIEGNVLWGCVMLGAFAVIIFFMIVAPSEV